MTLEIGWPIPNIDSAGSFLLCLGVRPADESFQTAGLELDKPDGKTGDLLASGFCVTDDLGSTADRLAAG